MSDIINLKQQRKAKARSEKEKSAEQNRLKFGRTKQEKQIEKLKSEKAERHIIGHKLDSDDNP